jgi:hypothetical protein
MRRHRTPGIARSDPPRRHSFASASQRSHRSPALLLTAALATLAVMAGGCGSSGTSTTTGATGTTPSVSTPAASAPATTPAAPTSTTSTAGGLTGTWSGQYNGAYQGTFKLTWQQSGSNLSGTITLSAPASTAPIHGTLAGSTISFGTVGSVAITYTGSVSGSSMSGSYVVGGAAGGSWSANKTS